MTDDIIYSTDNLNINLSESGISTLRMKRVSKICWLCKRKKSKNANICC